METPIVTPGGPKPEVQKPAAAKPPASSPRGEARAGAAAPDRAAISTQAQTAAARAREQESESKDKSARVGARSSPPADSDTAAALAHETSRQIVAHPVVSARAQAHSDAAAVLAMLQ